MRRRRWFLGPYVRFIAAWLRYGKPVLSKVIALIKAREPVDLKAPFAFSKICERNPSDLEGLAQWLVEHTEWISDPLWGLLDFFPSAEHIEWQLDHGDGIFRDDCDGLAYLTALAVRPFCDDATENFLVTVIYDPLEVPVRGSAHVLNLFKHRGQWRIASNALLDSKAWETPCSALYDNGYYHQWCRGAELQYIEVRDAQLRLLASGLKEGSALFGCDLSHPNRGSVAEKALHSRPLVL